MITITGFAPSCTPGSDGGSETPDLSQRTIPLNSLDTGTVVLNGNPINVWLAQSDDETQEGLMYVGADDMAADQGMLFVFSYERIHSFWMKNTYIPLDIAFIRTDGEIVTIYQMEPLDLSGHSSIEPVRFALELHAGTLERLGVQEGDRVIIPDEVLKD